MIEGQAGHLQKNRQSDVTRNHTLCNINNWSYWLYRNGKSGRTPYNNNSGGVYPRGTAIVVYQDGLVWGARVNDEVRVGGQTYIIGTKAVSDHIYRIRWDWARLPRADLVRDAGELFNVPDSAVTDSMLEIIRDNYLNDWKNWPVDKGAPYVDVDKNGVYNPVLDENGMPDFQFGDYPGVAGADQVIWFEADDRDEPRTYNLYGSKPLGLDLQVTVWAYKAPDEALGQAIFKRYKVTNTASETFKEMYLSQWTDTDLGDYRDDLAGCDSVLNAMFTYNVAEDSLFSALDEITPAMAYVLLSGPVVPAAADSAWIDFKRVPGYRNLPMTAFAYYAAGSTTYVDPAFGRYEGTLAWYNLMRGYEPTADLLHPSPFRHLKKDGIGPVTHYPLNGDPVSGTGDVDGQGANFKASFRHMAMVSGPFDLAPGESQEMTVALVGGQGSTYLNSVSVLKDNIRAIQNIYKNPSLWGSTFVPTGFKLFQNYPNPFNPITHIRYTLPVAEKVNLTVFNLLGQKVRTLVNEKQQAGAYNVSFDGQFLASGVYFYRLRAGKEFSGTRKLILLK